MKRRNVLVLLIFACVIAFLLIRNNINSKNFTDFIGNDALISKVTMMNGNDGKSVSTTDKTKIKELVTILNNTHYSRASNQEGKTGFSYAYTFYVGNKPVLSMWDTGYMVNVYDTYYDTTIEPRDGIKSWYNSLL